MFSALQRTGQNSFEFDKFKNIDQVYFESPPGTFQLVFDRSIYERVEAEQVNLADLQTPTFLQMVEARLVDHDIHAFNIVKKLSAELGNIDWLSRDAVGTLIGIAEDFIKREDFENTLWIIRHLRGNSDPSIRCLMCWPMQKLIVLNRPEFYPELLDILEEYATDQEESVRAHVGIPLTELAARRRSRNEDGTIFMPTEVSARVRTLAFYMLPNATGDVADRLASVFSNIRDVSTKEALDIVRKLGVEVRGTERHDVSVLILYFAIYREHQFEELEHFDSAPLRQFFSETLARGNSSLRSSLVWTIWKGLNEDVQIEDVQIEDVLPYLPAVTQGEFDRSTFNHLYRIISAQFSAGNNSVCDLFLSAVRREAEFLLAAPDHQVWHLEDFFESVQAARKLCSEKIFSEIRAVLLTVVDRLGVSTAYIEQLVG